MNIPTRLTATYRTLCTTLVALLACTMSATAQSPADSAWLAGDVDRAGELYAQRLAADSTDELALHRVALMHAWDARYEESLELFDLLVSLAPDNAEALLDRAKVTAWRGDIPEAIREVERVLEMRPSYMPALAARARYEAWSGDLSSAISMQDELLQQLPGDRDAWISQATYLVWDDRLQEAVAIYDSLLRTDSADRQSRLGLAQALAWSGQLDSASRLYVGMLEQDREDIEALMGYARVAAWGGQLKEAEERWRRAVKVDPDNGATHAGLGQTLRWQGREAAAQDALTRATQLAPGNREAADELVELRRGFAPRAGTRLVFVSDSDDNETLTLETRGSWHPAASLLLEAQAYARDARIDDGTQLQRASGGLLLGATIELEPGWDVKGSLGASLADGTGSTTAVLGATVTTPGRNSVVGSLGVSRTPLDESALLIDNGVVVEQVSVGARAQIGRVWRVDGSVSVARFEGTTSNRRFAGTAYAVRTLSSSWSLGLFTRAFGFQKNLQDGYFDPDLYWIGELTGQWKRSVGNWRFSVDAAPGVQHVGSGGATSATVRAAGRVAVGLGPGREIGLDARYSASGLSSFSSGGSDYEYVSVGVAGSWAFD
jgi:tetratricopeptide (TPR) repeat protein